MKNMDRIKVIIMERTMVNEDVITGDAILKDIGIDSLDLIDISMEVEDEFEILVNDSDIDGWKTANDILKTIEKYENLHD
jgi:acyl carrier protein